MIETRRRAYLEAMGFDVWVGRSAAQPPSPSMSQSMAQSMPSSGLLVVGPGQGSTLLVCASADQTAGKFAADLTRALGGDPAWAWPDRGGPGGGGGDGLGLEAAIGARLITRVIIFGADTACWLFDGAVPEVVASAVVSTLCGLEELAVGGAAKRALWQRLQNPLRGGSVSLTA